MKAYSLAVATKADNSEPDEPVSFGTETEERDNRDDSDISSYSTEKNDEDASISQLLSSAGGLMSKSPFGNEYGGLSLAQRSKHLH